MQKIKAGITLIITFIIPVYIGGNILEKIGMFFLTPPTVYYVLALIVFFIFWYGFFELAKK